jgi:hypothetical protein
VIIFDPSTGQFIPSGGGSAAVAPQNANTVYAGPAAGPAALPTFRALVAADLPSLSSLYWSVTGNSGLTDGVDNLLGTNDAVPVNLRSNGLLQVRYNSDGKGWLANQTYDPTNGVSLNQYDHRVDLQPSASTATANNTALYTALYYDNANAGYDYGGNITASSFRLEHRGSGTVNYSSVIDGSILFDNGGTTTTFKGIDLQCNIDTYTVNSLNPIITTGTITTSTVTGINGITASFQLQDSTLGFSNMMYSSIDLIGASTLTGNIDAIFSSVNLRDTTNGVAGNITGLTLPIGIEDTASINSISGTNISIQMIDSSVATGVTADGLSIDVRDSASGGNVNGINTSIQVRNAATASSITAVSFLAATDNTAAITNGITGIQGSVNMNGTSSAAYVSGISGGVNLNDTSVVVGGVQGSNIGVTTAVGASAASITLGNFSYNGLATISQVDGINVNLNGPSPNIKRVLVGNGGGINIGYDIGTDDVTLPAFTYNINSFNVNFNVAAGFPITTAGAGTPQFGILNSFGGAFLIEDDVDPDFTGVRLGHSMVGSFGAVAVVAGKTIDFVNLNMAGAYIPGVSTGGTATDVACYRALGVVPDGSGGTLAITNLYGFRVDSVFTAGGPTNAWGVFVDDPNAENYFSKSVAIGTSSKVAFNSSYGLHVDESKLALFGDGNIITGDLRAQVRIGATHIDPSIGVAANRLGLISVLDCQFTADNSSGIINNYHLAKLKIDAGFTLFGPVANNFAGIGRADAADGGTVQMVFNYVGNLTHGGNVTKTTDLYAAYFTGFHSIDNMGTITSMYDFYAQASGVGSSVVNRYGIVIEADAGHTKQNFISGLLQVGGLAVAVPQSALQVEDSVTMLQVVTPASNPSAGYNKLYFKGDDFLYSLDSAGNEKLITPSSNRVEKSGFVALGANVTVVTVTFATPFVNPYTARACLRNTTDGVDMNNSPVSVYAQTLNDVSFLFQETDNANYELCWDAVENYDP